jgi:hypothetical protein
LHFTLIRDQDSREVRLEGLAPRIQCPRPGSGSGS